jgi:uncharacterized protein
MTASPKTLAIALLIVSNVFMTVAWYWHLKFHGRPTWVIIIVSWGIAFLEYCFAVPANRIGSEVYTAAQLKGSRRSSRYPYSPPSPFSIFTRHLH